MPAEWEPHEATWIAWPHNRTDWPGKFAVIPWAYAEIVKKLAAGEIVRVIVESQAHEARARRILSPDHTVELFDLKTGAPSRSISGFDTPHSMLLLLGQNQIYVIDGGEGGAAY